MAAILVAKQVVARRWPGEREARARMRLLAANPENRELQIMSTEEKTAVREVCRANRAHARGHGRF